MMRCTFFLSLLATAACVSGCGEKPQTLGASKHNVAAYQGVENPFAAPGWKAGDKTSWEQGLKARMLNTQNEYPKMTAPPK